MVEAHVGEEGLAEVSMTDAQGNPTDRYDVAGGIRYSSSHPDQVSVIDDDAEPKDARIEFLGLTPDGVDAFVDVVFDGDSGEGQREITLRSEPIRVVAGDAVGGTVTIRFAPVAPPAEPA